MKTGTQLIAIERKRQIEQEGWTLEHDKNHKNHELYVAGCCYYSAERMRAINDTVDYGCPNDWPWEEKWWKPTPDNRIKELVKAGALFQAQYDVDNNEFFLFKVGQCAKAIDKILNLDVNLDVIVKITAETTLEELLMDSASVIDEKYYYIPFWFERVSNPVIGQKDSFNMFGMEKLPEELKKSIEKRRQTSPKKEENNL